MQKNNTSGYRGLVWRPKKKRWAVRIGYQGKFFRLGLFKDIVDAAKAYDKAAVNLFGEFARPNFPMPGTLAVSHTVQWPDERKAA